MAASEARFNDGNERLASVRRLAALLAGTAISAGIAGCSSGTTIAIGPDQVSVRTGCHDTQLRASVTSGGGEASQPFVIIAVTDNGPSCSINGYPRIVAASGYPFPQGWRRSLPITVVDGADYEHPDPGAHQITLTKGSAASFALGTSAPTGNVTGARPPLLS